ncbi:MAG: transposase, partial [Verrucomicrobia bacterium]|nr:transposase [Verrucomicrobiota bacterium]
MHCLPLGLFSTLLPPRRDFANARSNGRPALWWTEDGCVAAALTARCFPGEAARFSGNDRKNDAREAWALGEALRLHHPRWKPLTCEDALTRKLQVLTRDEQGFIAQMNQLTNQLQHALGQYYPQALELFSNWTSPTCPPCGEQLGFCVAIPNAAGIPDGYVAQAPELSPRASLGQARAVGGVEKNPCARRSVADVRGSECEQTMPDTLAGARVAYGSSRAAGLSQR